MQVKSKLVNYKYFLSNQEEREIKLSNRYIKILQKEDDFYITIIKLKKFDNIINDVDFLDYDEYFVIEYEKYLDNGVFTLEYPKDEIV